MKKYPPGPLPMLPNEKPVILVSSSNVPAQPSSELPVPPPAPVIPVQSEPVIPVQSEPEKDNVTISSDDDDDENGFESHDALENDENITINDTSVIPKDIVQQNKTKLEKKIRFGEKPKTAQSEPEKDYKGLLDKINPPSKSNFSNFFKKSNTTSKTGGGRNRKTTRKVKVRKTKRNQNKVIRKLLRGTKKYY
jgi:hypothetical protein